MVKKKSFAEELADLANPAPSKGWYWLRPALRQWLHRALTGRSLTCVTCNSINRIFR